MTGLLRPQVDRLPILFEKGDRFVYDTWAMGIIYQLPLHFDFCCEVSFRVRGVELLE